MLCFRMVFACSLLELFYSNYHFIEHLNGIRRYLLLGQGDFIHHLMVLLQYVLVTVSLDHAHIQSHKSSPTHGLPCRPELPKPADKVFVHNLNGLLETAVRATNAQYDSQQVLSRLDVRLLEVWLSLGQKRPRVRKAMHGCPCSLFLLAGVRLHGTV
jgi:gamma-tubulin complex component 3